MHDIVSMDPVKGPLTSEQPPHPAFRQHNETSPALLLRSHDAIETLAGMLHGDGHDAAEAREHARLIFFQTIARRINGRAGSDLAPQIDAQIPVVTGPATLAWLAEQTAADRRAGGVHFTPAPVAAFMCQEALRAWLCRHIGAEADALVTAIASTQEPAPPRPSTERCRLILDAIRSMRVLDPACGGGIFLLKMAELIGRLYHWLGGDAGGQEQAVARPTLCGIERDAATATAARVCLQQAFDQLADSYGIRFEGTVHIADALLLDTLPPPEPPEPPSPAPRRGAAVDVIIMNPPYLPGYSRRAAGSRMPVPLLRQRYGEVTGGRVNLFACFMAQSLRWLSPNGAMVCLLPDVIAAGASHRRLRRAIDQRLPAQRWWLLREAVFDAAVRNVIFSGHVAWDNTTASRRTAIADSLSALLSQFPDGLPPARSLREPGEPVRFFHNPSQALLRVHLRQQPHRLDDFFIVRDGVNPGPAHVRKRLLDVSHDDPARHPLIDGSRIDRNGYRLLPAVRNIRYDPALLTPDDRRAGASMRQPWVFAPPKLISRQTADTLIAAIDADQGDVALNSIHCTRLRNAFSQHVDALWGLLVLLNSPLMRLFYALDGGDRREVMPQVHIAWLRMLPLPADAMAWLTSLAPLGRQLRDNPGDADWRHTAHEHVCAGYGLFDADASEVLREYGRMYPRYMNRHRQPERQPLPST